MNPEKIWQTTTIGVSQARRQFSQLIQRANEQHEVFVLTWHNKPKAVLIGVETIGHLVNSDRIQDAGSIPIDELQRGLQKALEEGGYDTPEKIVALVREVKQDMAKP